MIETDIKVKKALADLAAGKFLNVSQAAKHHKLSSSTLARRFNGGLSIAESREPEQLLSIAEEDALARMATRLTTDGNPISHATLRQIAEELRNRRLRGINEPFLRLVTYEPIGQQWVQRFVQRYPHLRTVRGTSIELARVKESRREVFDHFFSVLQQTMEEHQIKWENVYNADETGFSIGSKKSTGIIIDSRLKNAGFQIELSRREWVTVMECVCTDGMSIPPLIIFKGDGGICEH
jgi:hypothetical protein